MSATCTMRALLQHALQTSQKTEFQSCSNILSHRCHTCKHLRYSRSGLYHPRAFFGENRGNHRSGAVSISSKTDKDAHRHLIDNPLFVVTNQSIENVGI